ncbi:hypothetical protein [Magnetovibrio sp.]|uniref:hypothetical protein n=1 Tax=Magnetovibrio sp. TaxID=2024836 RepID=UPI002F945D6B
MTLKTDGDDFWDRVEHDMRVTQPTSYYLHALMMRIGIVAVLFTAVYLVLGTLLEPARGYFLSNIELKIHPIYWALAGVLFILGGAFLRFRAMGPIIEKLKNEP